MNILLIISHCERAKKIRHLLQSKGFVSDYVSDGSSGLEYALTGIYDLIVIGSELNDIGGNLLVRKLRDHKCQVPILMVSESSSSKERTEALKAGADYYIDGTCEPEEFLACIYALIRRLGGQIEEWKFGNTTFILSSGILDCNGTQIRLTAREFEIMHLLMQNPEQHHSKERILAHVWGYDSNAVENHVEVYIGFLRKKLKIIGSDIRIVSVRRMGYHLECR